MEHANEGTLFDYLENCGPMTEKEVQALFRPLLSVVHYCHQRHIIHRDLKPENILVDGEMNVKLADLGLSRVFMKEKLTTYCGTAPYIAPELFRFELYEGLKVDIWNMGVVLYRMVTGELPFCDKEFWQIYWVHLEWVLLYTILPVSTMPKTVMKINNPQPQPKTNPGRYHERLLGQHWAVRGTETRHTATLGCRRPPGSPNNEDHGPWAAWIWELQEKHITT